MARVLIRSASGKERIVSARKAAWLVSRGAFAYVHQSHAAVAAESSTEVPEEVDLETLTVAELRERAAGLEVVGTGTGGNVVKADLVRALNPAPEEAEADAGVYSRRDMRAE